MEEKYEDLGSAMDIVRKGLQELPRYGPLWFGLLRFSEAQDTLDERKGWIRGRSPVLPRVKTEADAAIRCISKVSIWKIHFYNDFTSAGMYCKPMKPQLGYIRRSHCYEKFVTVVTSAAYSPVRRTWEVSG